MKTMKKKLLLSCVFGFCFLLLIVLLRTVDVAAIGPAGTSVGFSRLNGAMFQAFGQHAEWYTITKILGICAILTAVFFIAVGVIQLFLRKSIRLVDKRLLLLGALYAAVAVLYVLFDKVVINYRPILVDGSPEPSFPSTHTMLTCVIMGSAILLLKHYIRNQRLSLALRSACGAVIVLTAVGRLLAGVHWFTDVLGGILISCTLLCLYAAFLDKLYAERP